MKKIKTAILGCGRVSRFHAEAYQKIDNVELVGGVDIKQSARENFTAKYKVPCYNSIEELLKVVKPDLVSVCTPHHLHYIYAKELIKNKINLVIEKPVTLNLEETEELISLKKQYGVKVTIGFQNRFNNGIGEIDRMVENNTLGKVLMGNITLRWYRGQEYYSDEWHGSKEKCGGGVLITQAIHHLDLLRKYMGLPVDVKGYAGRLKSISEVEDALVAVMKYDNNRLATIDCAAITYPEHLEASLTLICEKGTIKVGGKSLSRIEYCNVPNYKYDKEDDSFVHLYGTGHINLLTNMIDCLQNNKEPIIKLEDGLETQKLLTKIYKSVEYLY